MNTSRINKSCSSYPCHKDLEDCTFCYCPYYPCEDFSSGGRYLTIYDGTGKHKIWDCTQCVLPHKKEFVDEIHKLIKENKKLPKNGAND